MPSAKRFSVRMFGPFQLSGHVQAGLHSRKKISKLN
jgi:hypothetical protein